MCQSFFTMTVIRVLYIYILSGLRVFLITSPGQNCSTSINILGYFHLPLCCQVSCDQNVWYHVICTYSWLTVCVNRQAEGELSSLKVGRVPVVTAGGSPVFLPLSREDQAGQLNPHLPVIILEPSGLVHTSLLTGETRTHWHIYCRLVDACTHSRP